MAKLSPSSGHLFPNLVQFLRPETLESSSTLVFRPCLSPNESISKSDLLCRHTMPGPVSPGVHCHCPDLSRRHPSPSNCAPCSQLPTIHSPPATRTNHVRPFHFSAQNFLVPSKLRIKSEFPLCVSGPQRSDPGTLELHFYALYSLRLAQPPWPPCQSSKRSRHVPDSVPSAWALFPRLLRGSPFLSPRALIRHHLIEEGFHDHPVYNDSCSSAAFFISLLPFIFVNTF